MQPTAVLLYDRITDRKTEPARSRFGGEIRVEDLAGNVIRDSGASISYRNLQIPSRRQQRLSRLADLNITRADPNGSAVNHCFAGIQHQCIHDLLDLPFIHLRSAKILGNIEVSAQVRTIERKLSRLLQEP